MTNTTAIFGDLDLMSEEASAVAQDDVTISLDGAEDSPTSFPCGITISITLDC